jgi:hypothetical protein
MRKIRNANQEEIRSEYSEAMHKAIKRIRSPEVRGLLDRIRDKIMTKRRFIVVHNIIYNCEGCTHS